MEHIIARHMQPVKFGKSYFLSRDETYLCYILSQTILNPDQITIHHNDNNKRVLKKSFPFQIGVHGYNGKPCHVLTAIVGSMNNDVFTAFPTMK